MRTKILVFLCAFCLTASSIMLYKSHNNKQAIKKTLYYVELQTGYTNNLKNQLLSCNDTVDKFTKDMEFISVVDVTMYNAVPGQTDSTPLITASNRTINPNYATDHRWIAVSRDLHRRWGGPLNFGDRVYVKGTSNYDGIYTVHDLMNSRFTTRIDILRNEDGHIFKYGDVELYRFINVAPDYHNSFTYNESSEIIHNSAR